MRERHSYLGGEYVGLEPRAFVLYVLQAVKYKRRAFVQGRVGFLGLFSFVSFSWRTFAKEEKDSSLLTLFQPTSNPIPRSLVLVVVTGLFAPPDGQALGESYHFQFALHSLLEF